MVELTEGSWRFVVPDNPDALDVRLVMEAEMITGGGDGTLGYEGEYEVKDDIVTGSIRVINETGRKVPMESGEEVGEDTTFEFVFRIVSEELMEGEIKYPSGHSLRMVGHLIRHFN